MNDRVRLGTIALAVVVMVAIVWVAGSRLGELSGDRPADTVITTGKADLSREAGQFLSPGLSRFSDGGSASSLAERDGRRAFAGAPPVIPHPVRSEMAGGERCLSCHGEGTWTPQWAAHAPPTPHPQLAACQQCHVERVTDDLFRETEWSPFRAARADEHALPGAPPPTPHTIEQRSACLLCHAGPAAPTEIRMKHEERSGCLQCHPAQVTGETWSRNADGDGR